MLLVSQNVLQALYQVYKKDSQIEIECVTLIIKNEITMCVLGILTCFWDHGIGTTHLWHVE